MPPPPRASAQRQLELLVAARDLAVELAPQRLLAAPRRSRATRARPPRRRSSPVISRRMSRRSATQRSTGSAGAPSASASASASGGSRASSAWSSDGAAQRRRAARPPARGAVRAARAARRRARPRVRCEVGRAKASASGVRRDQRGQAGQDAVGAGLGARRARRAPPARLGVAARGWSARSMPRLAHPRDARPGASFSAQQVQQLVADTRARRPCAARRPRRLARQALGVGVHAEAQPGLVAHGAQQARGVVDEAAVVQHPHDARLQVGRAAVRVVQVPEVVAREPDGHRVDREVAPAPGPRPAPPAPPRAARPGSGRSRGGWRRGRRQVVRPHRRRAEALVLARPRRRAAPPASARPRARRPRPPGRGRRRAPAQQVAHRAADEVGRRQPVEGGQAAGHRRAARGPARGVFVTGTV